MKSLDYPMVALEQCSRSVMVEEAIFPSKFMLLLGNERIGAPASLLNEGDLLVEIPQIGKIRSLNVHVSMVLCLW
jgi:tRNA G18 (ribose-2'-O)-methylase SpoU